jgi:hypothetical protein
VNLDVRPAVKGSPINDAYVVDIAGNTNTWYAFRLTTHCRTVEFRADPSSSLRQ